MSKNNKGQTAVSRQRIWLFRVIAIILPFMLLAMFEGGLRLVGYGKTVPLFIENPQAPEYMLPKPDVVSRYFANPEDGPNVTIETNFFLKDKPKNGLRIFVQGGSTAAGFPFGYGASIAGMLDYRLKQTFPNREVEVINTALSAVNSYTLLDFSDEIIAQQPDAIFIYAGHNEFLGIMGVGSTYSAYNSYSANLLYLKLKDLRLFQLVQSLYNYFKSSDYKQGDTESADIEVKQQDRQSRTVMAKVAKHKHIDVEEPLFKAGIDQFRNNMTMLIKKYHAAGIPVFISTIASNLADQPPFESHDLEEKFQSLINKASSKEGLNSFELSILEIEATKSRSAIGYYTAAKILYDRGQYIKAKQLFILARQHDLLRFRAPLEINQVIRQLAALNGVTLVESEAQLFKAAKTSIIGKDLMIEHLHPTVKGYFEISDAFYNVFVDHVIDGFNEGISGTSANPVDKKTTDFARVTRFEAKQDLPIFAPEEYKGYATIAGLMADYPFTQTPEKVMLPAVKSDHDKLGLALFEKKATWMDVAQAALKEGQLKGDKRLTIKAAKLLSDAIPYDKNLAYQAGSLLIQVKQPKQAFRYLKRALRHDSNFINAQLALAHASILVNDFQQAQQWLLSVKAIDPNNEVVAQNLPEINKALKAQTHKAKANSAI